MKIFLVSQDAGDFAAAVVIAESADVAQHMNPLDGELMDEKGEWVVTRKDGSTYTSRVAGMWSVPSDIKVEELGEAVSAECVRRVVCSDYRGY